MESLEQRNGNLVVQFGLLGSDLVKSCLAFNSTINYDAEGLMSCVHMIFRKGVLMRNCV